MRCILKAVVLIQKVRDAICLNSNLAGKLLLGQQRNVNEVKPIVGVIGGDGLIAHVEQGEIDLQLEGGLLSCWVCGQGPLLLNAVGRLQPPLQPVAKACLRVHHC